MKILIADDEDYTREGLIESVSWGKYDIDEIMQAVNGLEAIKIAKWFRPDIVLTDVRMPKMDGIKFATDVRMVLSAILWSSILRQERRCVALAARVMERVLHGHAGWDGQSMTL